MLHEEQLTERIIAAAIEVHRHLGPGLLESAYEACLCRELHLAGLRFTRQEGLPVEYKGIHLECGYRTDVIVENRVVVEVKAVQQLSAGLKHLVESSTLASLGSPMRYAGGAAGPV